MLSDVLRDLGEMQTNNFRCDHVNREAQLKMPGVAGVVSVASELSSLNILHL